MSLQYLTVQVGGTWYGIPLVSVVEALHMVALADLPEADADILGLLTLRDHIMPVIDLRVRFHCHNTQLHMSTPLVAIRGHKDEQMVGFVVDDVDSVVILSTEMRIQTTHFPYVMGAVQLENHMLLLLDISSFFAEINLAAPASPQ